MKKQTEGRLVIRDGVPHIAETADGMQTIFETMQPAPVGIRDASRLVLCWNICDGISTDELHEMDLQLISLHSIKTDLANLKG